MQVHRRTDLKTAILIVESLSVSLKSEFFKNKRYNKYREDERKQEKLNKDRQNEKVHYIYIGFSTCPHSIVVIITSPSNVSSNVFFTTQYCSALQCQFKSFLMIFTGHQIKTCLHMRREQNPLKCSQSYDILIDDNLARAPTAISDFLLIDIKLLTKSFF